MRTPPGCGIRSSACKRRRKAAIVGISIGCQGRIDLVGVAAFPPNRYDELRAESQLEKHTASRLRGGIGGLRIGSETALGERRDVSPAE